MTPFAFGAIVWPRFEDAESDWVSPAGLWEACRRCGGLILAERWRPIARWFMQGLFEGAAKLSDSHQ